MNRKVKQRSYSMLFCIIPFGDVWPREDHHSWEVSNSWSVKEKYRKKIVKGQCTSIQSSI